MIIIHDMTATVSLEAVEFAIDHPACRNWAGEGYCSLPYVKHHCNNYCAKWEARADTTPLLVESGQARASERRASLLRLEEAHSARVKPRAEGSANVPSGEEEARTRESSTAMSPWLPPPPLGLCRRTLGGQRRSRSCGESG